MVERMISWEIAYLGLVVKLHRFCVQNWINRLTSEGIEGLGLEDPSTYSFGDNCLMVRVVIDIHGGARSLSARIGSW